MNKGETPVRQTSVAKAALLCLFVFFPYPGFPKSNLAWHFNSNGQCFQSFLKLNSIPKPVSL